MPRALSWSWEGVLFLMSEVPLCVQRRSVLNQCSVAGKYNEFFPYCFPPLSDEGKGGPVSKVAFFPCHRSTLTACSHP